MKNAGVVAIDFDIQRRVVMQDAWEDVDFFAVPNSHGERVDVGFASAALSDNNVPLHIFVHWIANWQGLLNRSEWEEYRNICNSQDLQVDHNDRNVLNVNSSNLILQTKHDNLKNR